MASADTARRFVRAVMDHVDGILVLRSPVEPVMTSDRG
ncbi:MAG: hypothetical protein QOI06_2573 [Nocardioidaceae bacterium]|nr:hypothetical protein [Nocardioidaceae bacterium]